MSSWLAGSQVNLKCARGDGKVAEAADSLARCSPRSRGIQNDFSHEGERPATADEWNGQLVRAKIYVLQVSVRRSVGSAGSPR